MLVMPASQAVQATLKIVVLDGDLLYPNHQLVLDAEKRFPSSPGAVPGGYML
jgi:hypothetical protein